MDKRWEQVYTKRIGKSSLKRPLNRVFLLYTSDGYGISQEFRFPIKD